MLHRFSPIACCLLLALVAHGQPANHDTSADDAGQNVEALLLIFPPLPGGDQDLGEKPLEPITAEKLAETTAILKEFRRLLAADDPRRWNANLLELQLAGRHTSAGQPQNEPDTAALAQRILTAADASTEVKGIASFIQLMRPVMDRKTLVKMSAQERGAWRKAARLHLQTYPDVRYNQEVKLTLNAADTDGDTPVPSGKSADEAWKELQIAMRHLRKAHETWKNEYRGDEELTDRFTKRLTEFDSALVSFISVAPADPRRWEAKTAQLEMRGWHKKVGNPEFGVDLILLAESILAAPDASEQVKEEASGIYVTLVLPFKKKTDGRTVRTRKEYRAHAEQHLTRFPKSPVNRTIRLTLEQLAKWDAQAAEKAWIRIQDAMDSVKNPPQEILGNVEKVKGHLTKTLYDFDTAIQEFNEAAPQDPRRWDIKALDLEIVVRVPFLKRPGREPDVPSVVREILEAPDASKETKGNANALRLLMMTRSWKTVEQIPPGGKEQWTKAAEEHLKEYPDCPTNAEIKGCLKVINPKATR